MLTLRGGKRVRDVLHTQEGKKLHVVEYRIPYPGYRAKGCSGLLREANPDDILEGLWAAAVESVLFASVIERIAGGLGHAIREDHALGVGLHAYAGAALAGFVMSVQQQELLPLLIRASEIRSQEAVDRFVAAWNDRARRGELLALAKEILTRRSREKEADLTRRMRAIGLTLRGYRSKGGEKEEDMSLPRKQLRFIINASASLGGG